jgi:DNA-binding GntR family transcriptional regulator
LTVYERLYEDVVAGVWDESPLVELALAARYGVSRTPVREALRRLEQDGLIERRDRSLRVRARSPEEILEIYEVRIALEGLAARAAAEHASQLDVARLRRAQADVRAADATAPRAMAAANRRFHEALWAAGHSAALEDLLRRLQGHLRRYPETTLSAPGRWEQVLAEHDELIELIAAGEGERARAAAERHMAEARELRLRMFAEGD